MSSVPARPCLAASYSLTHARFARGGGGSESTLPRLKARVSPATGGRGCLGRWAEGVAPRGA